jgi:hypothetical protein
MPSGSAMAVEEEAFTEREELSECEVFKIGENKAEDDEKREKEEIGEERMTLPFALVCPSFLKVDEKITFSSLRQQQEAIFIASGLIIKEKGSFYSFPSMYSSLVNVTCSDHCRERFWDASQKEEEELKKSMTAAVLLKDLSLLPS